MEDSFGELRKRVVGDPEMKQPGLIDDVEANKKAVEGLVKKVVAAGAIVTFLAVALPLVLPFL